MRVIWFSVVLLALTGCLGAPELPTLDEVELAEDAASSGLIAPDKPAPKSVLEELQSIENLPGVPDQATQDKPRGGLFGLFKRNHADATEEDADATPDGVTAQDAQNTPPEGAGASQAKEAVTETPEAESIDTPHRGLFGPRRNRAPGPNVTPGTVLPFGEIGVACGVRGRALGKEVERFPAKGKGYRLFDSDPTSTALRTHYLTGFKDGCPRQFTAALAMIGSPELHEQMRYDQYNKDLPYTDADKAYEQIKQRICKVSKGQLCPEERIGALENGMAFVTLYERFGDNASWEEILLHKGKVAGSSLRKR